MKLGLLSDEPVPYLNPQGPEKTWVGCFYKISFCNNKGYSRKKYLGGEDGRRYIFLWVVGAHIFQIIWVLGV